VTERLYYRDAELLRFEATVVGHGKDARHVVLDRTAFYPTSGGQPHDTGMLNGVRVVDVVDEDDRVVHVLEADLPPGAVHGEIDAARRHDHMEQHTAQHLLSAIAADRFGWDTASVHFGADHSTIEFDTANASDAALRELEAVANAAIATAHPVTVGFEASDVAVARGLRKAPARSGEIRIVTIDGVDRSACGGTHLASTAAIGAVVLQGVERIRGHLRVGFLAGNRVRSRLHAREALLAAVAEVVSCAVDELPAMVTRRQAELKALRDRLEALEREVAVARLTSAVAMSAVDSDGVRRVVRQDDSDSPALLRAMVQEASLVDHLLFVATIPAPPTVFVASGPGTGIDAGARLKAALTLVGGRGGGSPKAAQGTVPESGLLQGIVNQLVGPG
jgi:alanyl-tRNA synthetase